MSGDVELLFLERVQQERWQFKTKPHEHFDALMDAVVRASIFHIRTIYFTPGSVYARVGKCYEVSNDGMQFFRPLFANYEEMAAKAGHAYYRPFEEQEKAQERYCCIFCGVSGLIDKLIECNVCHNLFCSSCIPLHKFSHAQQESEERKKQQQYEHTFNTNWDPADAFGYTFEDLFPYARMRGSAYRSTTGTPPKPNVPKNVRDAFDLLSLAYTANAAQIKKAFKAKALVTHPDRGGSHADMVKLNKAKEIALAFAGK